mmetsp:Transcript_51691/g.85739  ORF Transcript_51691/g.85739 Transcript_51691/m.85739 type:complete len:249 (+) Transcript_51691:236-982(+)
MHGEPAANVMHALFKVGRSLCEAAEATSGKFSSVSRPASALSIMLTTEGICHRWASVSTLRATLLSTSAFVVPVYSNSRKREAAARGQSGSCTLCCDPSSILEESMAESTGDAHERSWACAVTWIPSSHCSTTSWVGELKRNFSQRKTTLSCTKSCCASGPQLLARRWTGSASRAISASSLFAVDRQTGYRSFAVWCCAVVAKSWPSMVLASELLLWHSVRSATAHARAERPRHSIDTVCVAHLHSVP